MTFNKLRNLLLASLNKTGKQDQIISSIALKTIIDSVKEIKGMDLSSYIISVKVNKNIITIKTLKPIINTELTTIAGVLTKKVQEKLHSIGFQLKNIQLKFK